MPIADFVVQNGWLFLALVVILVLLARTWVGPGRIKSVNPMEAVQMINRQDALVVDVRTDKEFQEGHILNAVHIPLGVFKNRLAELESYKNHDIVLVCRSGARSGQAAAILNKQGFVSAHNLGGGIMAWQSASLPLTTETGKSSKLAPRCLQNAPHEVVVYTTRKCPFCVRAIELLEAKCVGYTEIRIDKRPELREEMERRSQRTTVPQIFVGEQHVGGCDDMYELESQGKLDALLGLEASK
jgi:GrxC family glutaredoxin